MQLLNIIFRGNDKQNIEKNSNSKYLEEENSIDRYIDIIDWSHNIKLNEYHLWIQLLNLLM